MMLGDAGYGLASMLIAFLLIKKFKGTMLEPVGKVWMFAAIPAIFFGIVYNEYFGFTHEHLLGLEHGLYPSISRMENISTLLVIFIFVGAAHLALGFLLGKKVTDEFLAGMKASPPRWLHIGSTTLSTAAAARIASTALPPSRSMCMPASVARTLEVAEGQRGTLEVNGIRIDAMRLSHGTPPPGRPDIVNLAYLVTAGGVKFFHTGDIDVNVIPMSYLQGLGVRDDHVDVAFVPHFLLSLSGPLPFVTEGIRPRFVVASHLQYTGEPPNEDQMRRNFPTAVLLRTEGERWVIP
jgi:hypothetical protein